MVLLGSESLSTSETVFWLNALLDNFWRVPFGDDGRNHPVMQFLHELGYPMFVSRAIQQTIDSKGCPRWPQETAVSVPIGCLPYGGLEPYLASGVGTALLETLALVKSSIPIDLAYVSLYSFTLGSRPPIIRSVKLRRANFETRGIGDSVELDLDVDMLMSDLSIVLGESYMPKIVSFIYIHFSHTGTLF
jgi:hypothetical protein